MRAEIPRGLIAESAPDVCASLERDLNDKTYAIRTASDAETAWKYLSAAQRIEIVALGKFNSRTAVGTVFEMRANKLFPQVSVVSGSCSREELADAIELGWATL